MSRGTYDAVVLAANGVGAAAALAGADDSDGAAVGTNKRIGVQDETKQRDEGGNSPPCTSLLTNETRDL